MRGTVVALHNLWEVPNVGEDNVRQHRRTGDDDDTFVGHARAADNFLKMVWGWGTMLITVIGFGVMIGKFWSVPTDIAELKRNYNETHTSDLLRDRDISQIKADNERLRDDLSKLLTAIESDRSMRESYVWSAANAILRKQPTISPPPRDHGQQQP